MRHALEISIARRKCLCMSGKVVLWSKHRDIRTLAPMFYLKLCNDVYISIIQSRIIKNEVTAITLFLVPRGGRKRAVLAISVDTFRGGRKGDPQHQCCGKEHLHVALKLLSEAIRKPEQIA